MKMIGMKMIIKRMPMMMMIGKLMNMMLKRVFWFEHQIRTFYWQ